MEKVIKNKIGFSIAYHKTNSYALYLIMKINKYKVKIDTV
jgi:hypothetical protein